MSSLNGKTKMVLIIIAVALLLVGFGIGRITSISNNSSSTDNTAAISESNTTDTETTSSDTSTADEYGLKVLGTEVVQDGDYKEVKVKVKNESKKALYGVSFQVKELNGKNEVIEESYNTGDISLDTGQTGYTTISFDMNDEQESKIKKVEIDGGYVSKENNSGECESFNLNKTISAEL